MLSPGLGFTVMQYQLATAAKTLKDRQAKRKRLISQEDKKGRCLKIHSSDWVVLSPQWKYVHVYCSGMDEDEKLDCRDHFWLRHQWGNPGFGMSNRERASFCPLCWSKLNMDRVVASGAAFTLVTFISNLSEKNDAIWSVFLGRCKKTKPINKHCCIQSGVIKLRLE